MDNLGLTNIPGDLDPLVAVTWEELHQISLLVQPCGVVELSFDYSIFDCFPGVCSTMYKTSVVIERQIQLHLDIEFVYLVWNTPSSSACRHDLRASGDREMIWGRNAVIDRIRINDLQLFPVRIIKKCSSFIVDLIF